MKTSWGIIWICFLIFSSCNIKEPLENVLLEANLAPAAYVQLRSSMDTISLTDYFPTLTAVDSVFGQGLIMRPLNPLWQQFTVQVKDSFRIIHEASVLKKGEKVSMLFYFISKKGSSQESFSITPTSILNNSLLFRCSKRPVEFYALWQNIVLPSRFISFSRSGFSIFIPKEAKTVERSYIRVFAANGIDSIIDLNIPLTYGIPASVNEWTKGIYLNK